jgi:hypothetical protein
MNIAIWLPTMFFLGIGLMAFFYWFIDLCDKI